ncbi:MAG: glycyl-radical enzyme activating protein [Candidatus Schekmanbacteria bacterium]|nr:glycyl-radical enzyme activating protein [Candidatus Schekmanbacteria bacterium]
MSTTACSSSTVTATVFDVQRFSIHDGPGIRTAVFFKGCSFHCAWCQNPESIRPRPEMAFYADRCIGCRRCESVCPERALRFDRAGRIDRSRCTACGLCARSCPSEALRLVGRACDAESLAAECLEDREFFESSGGGVTLSGGEPILQGQFLQQLLPRLRAERIHVLLETAGNYPWRLLEPVAPLLDHIYFDWKAPDDAAYRRVAGAGCAQVAENLGRLRALGASVTVRTPVVPGVNTEDEQVEVMSRTLADLGERHLCLLRYNHFWEAKLARLETRQTALGRRGEEIDYERLQAAFARHGIAATMAT